MHIYTEREIKRREEEDKSPSAVGKETDNLVWTVTWWRKEFSS